MALNMLKNKLKTNILLEAVRCSTTSWLCTKRKLSETGHLSRTKSRRAVVGVDSKVTFFSPELTESYEQSILGTKFKTTSQGEEIGLSSLPSKNIPPGEQRRLRVAMIGMPNAGKSSLVNTLMKRKLCAVSSKVHTTRYKSENIMVEHSSQIIFVDTPGLISQEECIKYKLTEPLLNDPKNAIIEADLLCVIHDVGVKANRFTFHPIVHNVLKYYSDLPSILVLTKVDKIKTKRDLLQHIDNLTAKRVNDVNSQEALTWSKFSDVFLTSSTKNQGVENLKKYLLSQTKVGEWLYPAHVVTDVDTKEVVINLVKAKLMDFLPNEMPYNISLNISHWHTNDAGVLEVIVSVGCKEHYMKYIIGDKGSKVKKIACLAQEDVMNMLKNEVYLRISVEKI